MPSKKYYYVSGNTAEGLVNFLPSNVENFKQIIILKHPSHTLKTTIIKNMVKEYENTHDLEIILSPIGDQFLEAVIIRELSMAIIIDQIAMSDLVGAIEIDLSLFLADKTVYPEINEPFTKAYNSFSTGLRVHDDLEAIYIKEMDFNKADQLAENLIKKIVTDEKKKNREPHVYRRLFGTNTTDGVVNIVPQIIESLSDVYHLKGRAGTGKSTFMKKMLAACIENGHDIELFHCSFDPHSVDMVLVSDLDFCIFDSTDPHEFFPRREGEEVIDLYEETVTPGTDEKYAVEIQAIHSNYKSFMKKGVEHLKEAGEMIEKVERKYVYSDKEIEKIVTFIIESSLL